MEASYYLRAKAQVPGKTDKAWQDRIDLVALQYCSKLFQLKFQPVAGYGIDEAWADYRHTVLYLWTYVSVVAGNLALGSDRAFAWMSKMVARNAAAIEDLDCLGLL